MPIEYCFRFPNTEEGGDIPVGQEIQFGHDHVEVPGAVIIPDFSSGEDGPTELIVIASKEADNGADIYYVPPEGPFDTDDYSQLSKEDLPEDVEKEELEEDVIFEEEITLADGTDVVLLIYHTPPDKISDGHMIPRGLIHPS